MGASNAFWKSNGMQFLPDLWHPTISQDLGAIGNDEHQARHIERYALASTGRPYLDKERAALGSL